MDGSGYDFHFSVPLSLTDLLTAVMTKASEATYTAMAHLVTEVYVSDSVTADLQLRSVSVQQRDDCKQHITTVRTLLNTNYH